MKKSLLIIISIVLAFGLFSCNESAAYRSPQITITSIAINSDTLGGNDVLDTLYVGDTLKLSALLNPYYDALYSFEVSIDRTYLQDSIFVKSDYEAFCDTTKSDPENGYYVFTGMVDGELMVVQNMRFIAMQTRTPASTRTPIQLILTSDAEGEDGNPTSLSVSILIQEKSAGDDDSEDADVEDSNADDEGNE